MGFSPAGIWPPGYTVWTLQFWFRRHFPGEFLSDFMFWLSGDLTVRKLPIAV